MKVLEIGTRRLSRDLPESVHWTTGIGEGLPATPSARNLISVWKEGLAVYRKAAEADIVLVEAMGEACIGPFWRRALKYAYSRLQRMMIVRIWKRADAPLIVFDLQDELTIHPLNKKLLHKCRTYFKRELSSDPYRSLEGFGVLALRCPPWGRRRRMVKEMEKLKPFSLGLGPGEDQARQLSEKLAQGEKTVDVFYAGDSEYRPLRDGIEQELKEWAAKADRVVSLPEERQDFESYAKEVARARLCLSPPGLGWDCYRHYEAGLLGSIPVMSYPDVQRHGHLRDGIEGFFYDPGLPLGPQFDRMLSDEALLSRMAEASKNRVLKHHLRETRLQRLLGEDQPSGLEAV